MKTVATKNSIRAAWPVNANGLVRKVVFLIITTGCRSLSPHTLRQQRR